MKKARGGLAGGLVVRRSKCELSLFVPLDVAPYSGGQSSPLDWIVPFPFERAFALN